MAIIIKTEAVVIKKVSLLNRDYSVFFFTREKGKLMAVAKGAKKLTSRRMTHLQTGNLLEVSLHSYKSHYYIRDSKLVTLLSAVKENLPKSRYLYFFLYLIDRLLPQEQQEIGVYQLMKGFFSGLHRAKAFDQYQMAQYFSRLLVLLGYGNDGMTFDEAVAVTENLIGEKLPREFV